MSKTQSIVGTTASFLDKAKAAWRHDRVGQLIRDVILLYISTVQLEQSENSNIPYQTHLFVWAVGGQQFEGDAGVTQWTSFLYFVSIAEKETVFFFITNIF